MKKYLLPLALLMTTHFQASAQLPDYVPQSNLEGWWSFTGSANDLSTHTRNGNVSGATLTTDRFGNANAAYSFNGTSDYIFVPNVAISDVTHSTVSAWLKPTGDANSSKYYDSYFNLGTYPGNSLGYAYEYNQKSFNIYGACKGTSEIVNDIRNQWHHIVVAQDGVKTSIYVDGAVADTFISSTPVCIGNNSSVFLGGQPDDFQWFTGSLDDMGFWTRTLSQCEIQDLYNASVLSFTTQPGNKNGAVGGAVSFTVNAGATAASYQWQSATGSSSTFTNLTNSGQYSGVMTNTLTVSALTTANNNQHFRCLVSNANNCNTLASTAATLTITSTGIDDVFANSVLAQNAPNPSSGQTTVRYYIPPFKSGANILVCDAGGRLIKTEKIATSGKGQVTFGQLSQGIYFYSLVVDGQKVRTQKMIIIQ